MKKQDVEELRRLIGLKQKAAALELTRCSAEQAALLDEAAQCLRESYCVGVKTDADPSAGDLAAANQYRKHLRAKSARLEAAARSLDDSIETMRQKTRRATNREIATDALLADAERQDRADRNQREEASREQITLLRF